MSIECEWRGAFSDDELNALHAEGFGHRVFEDRWQQGVGTQLVTIAVAEARAAGCEWLYVAFEEELSAFDCDSCGFRPTPAGLIRL